MQRMSDKYNTKVSFHVNLTDVNVGLKAYPETRAFFNNSCKPRPSIAAIAQGGTSNRRPLRPHRFRQRPSPSSRRKDNPRLASSPW